MAAVPGDRPGSSPGRRGNLEPAERNDRSVGRGPGGHPYPRRARRETVPCPARSKAYLGCPKVHRPGRVPYAQVRMVGVIGEFEPNAPDPDGGRMYRRYMAALSSAPGVLGWGGLAELQVLAAAMGRREWASVILCLQLPGARSQLFVLSDQRLFLSRVCAAFKILRLPHAEFRFPGQSQPSVCQRAVSGMLSAMGLLPAYTRSAVDGHCR
jgi:hypothetical protein